MTADADAAIATLAGRGVKTLPPLAFVLGSGLGVLADEAEDAISIPYAEIPGFPQPSVAGHKGRLVVGTLEGTRVALFQGRGHYYERGDPRAMATAIETLARLGGRTLFLTNAAGGLHTEWEPPALVAITDHINFAGTNPLIGHPGDERFVPLTRAYDPGLLATLRRAAKTAEVKLHEGVYMWFNGPSFETPAEIRMAKILGAESRGHVDRARSHSRAAAWPELRRRFIGHQLRGRALRRRSQPRGNAGIRRARLRAVSQTAARLRARSRRRGRLMLPRMPCRGLLQRNKGQQRRRRVDRNARTSLAACEGRPNRFRPRIQVWTFFPRGTPSRSNPSEKGGPGKTPENVMRWLHYCL